MGNLSQNTFRDKEFAMGKLFLSILVFSGIVIDRTESKRSRKSKSACVNPGDRIDTAGWTCSGHGECHKTRRGPDWCECDQVDRNGHTGIYHPRKRLYGKWCQCNPWNCVKYQLSDDSLTCSGHGKCECNEDDPIDDAKCVCEDGFNGRYCDTTDAELAQELEEIAALRLEADSLRFAGIIDAPDNDDDNDGIPDDKEVEVVDHDEDTESIPEIVEESDPCRNPSNSIEFSGRLCSGRGYCPAVSYWKQDRKCHCDRLKRPFKQGEYSQYLAHDGIFGRAFGNWCQCDPWNCMPDWSYGYVKDTCSGHGSCECQIDDPNSVAKCNCDKNHSGNVCQDNDEDNDGIPYDSEESDSEISSGDGDSESNEDGVPVSIHGDGESDSDDDNDGIPDEQEDEDGDGIPDHMEDDDDDDDGIPDSEDDSDNDGIPNYLDNDDDNDGIPDDQEKITDSSIRYDFMGRPIKDIIKYDIWGRPIKAVVIVPDNDKDGTPDELDDDDDNDGIPDVFEFKYLGSHKGPWVKNANDKRDIVCPRIKAVLTCESIVTTIKIKTQIFEKFKTIQWFDINNRQKKAILQQFKKKRKFQVHFYENGITFEDKNGTEMMPIRTSPYPILNLY